MVKDQACLQTMAPETFSPLDYIVLVLFLAISVLIGIYHAMCGTRQRTSSEYFLADRSMGPYPVGLSVLVSIVSAITYLGVPADTYMNGLGYSQMIVNKPFGMIFIVYVIIPVFYNLQVSSIFEYLEKRFNQLVRYTGMITNLLHIMVYMGIVIYTPSLALNSLTGLSIPGCILAVGVICTFYTTIGGIKAVVWTDAFQSVIMVCGMILTTIVATVSVGGVREVWRRAEEGERTVILDLSLDPTIKYSLWTCAIGGLFVMIPFTGTNQLIVQRYLTCRTLRDARIACVIGMSLFGAVEVLSVFLGTVTYAYFQSCDPLTTGEISKPDQIIPLLMLRLFSGVPGLTGLLVSAAFSASLSSVSSGINALVTITGQGIIRKIWPEMEETKFTLLSKFMAVVFGVICIVLAFVAPHLGNVLQIAISIAGVCLGPVCGMFLLGILFPWANALGTMVGFWGGVILGFWLQIGSTIFPTPRNALPLSVDSCPVAGDNSSFVESGSALSDESNWAFTTSVMAAYEDPTGAPALGDDLPTLVWCYHISYLYFGLVASVTAFVLGAIVSCVSGPTDPGTVDGKLLSPVVFSIHRRLPSCLRERVVLDRDPYTEAEEIDEDEMKVVERSGHVTPYVI